MVCCMKDILDLSAIDTYDALETCGSVPKRTPVGNPYPFSFLGNIHMPSPLGLISARFVRRTNVIPMGLSSTEVF